MWECRAFVLGCLFFILYFNLYISNFEFLCEAPMDVSARISNHTSLSWVQDLFVFKPLWQFQCSPTLRRHISHPPKKAIWTFCVLCEVPDPATHFPVGVNGHISCTECKNYSNVVKKKMEQSKDLMILEGWKLTPAHNPTSWEILDKFINFPNTY